MRVDLKTRPHKVGITIIIVIVKFLLFTFLFFLNFTHNSFFLLLITSFF